MIGTSVHAAKNLVDGIVSETTLTSDEAVSFVHWFSCVSL